MTKNLTVCPECTAEFGTVQMDETDDGMLQRLEQDCPDCDYETVVGIVNYPDGHYEVVGEAIEEDGGCEEMVVGPDRVEKCEEDATHRVQSPRLPPKSVCEDHFRSFQRRALDSETYDTE